MRFRTCAPRAPERFVQGLDGGQMRFVAVSAFLTFSYKPDVIADPDDARPHDVRVERKLVVEAPDDVLQYVRVDLERVRIDGRHVTAAAQRIQTHDRLADLQHRTRPGSFARSLDAADEDVRAQATDIPSERGDSAVGRHEQRQDVEPIETFRGFEPR